MSSRMIKEKTLKGTKFRNVNESCILQRAVCATLPPKELTERKQVQPQASIQML